MLLGAQMGATVIRWHFLFTADCTQWCTHRLSEVIVGHLKVVFGCHCWGVPQPFCDYVDRKIVDKFSFMVCTQVLKQPTPTGPLALSRHIILFLGS